MPADAFLLGLAQGIPQFAQSIQDVQNQNDDRAYKSLIAQMMVRKQIMDETAQGYHRGYGQPTPAALTTSSADPQVSAGIPAFDANGAAGPLSGAQAAEGTLMGSRMAAPAINVQAPPVGVQGAASPSMPTGFKGFIARMLHSGPYAGRGLPTLPDLGTPNGLTEQEAADQATEAAHRADVLQAQGFTTSRDQTQHGYDMDKDTADNAAAMARAKLHEKGETARSSAASSKQADAMLKAALADARTELDASTRDLRNVSNLTSGATDADRAAAREKYLQAYDHYKQLNGMISDRVGVPPMPPQLIPDAGSAGSGAAPASPKALAAANAIARGDYTLEQVMGSPQFSPEEKAEIRSLAQTSQNSKAFGDSVAAQLYNYKKP